MRASAESIGELARIRRPQGNFHLIASPVSFNVGSYDALCQLAAMTALKSRRKFPPRMFTTSPSPKPRNSSAAASSGKSA